MKIVDCKYVVFDVETTGLSAVNDQIIEIAARKIGFDGTFLDEFHAYVKLYKVSELSDFIVNLTKITSDFLSSNGEDVSDVMHSFLEFSSGCVLVAQNKKFDIGFLQEYFLNSEKMLFAQICVDTIDFAKVMFPNQQSYKLQSLCEMYECEYDASNHHQAMYDVEMTERVLVKQLNGLFDAGNVISDFLEYDGQGIATVRQKDYLMSLLSQKKLFLGEFDYVNKATASKLIDFLINN